MILRRWTKLCPIRPGFEYYILVSGYGPSYIMLSIPDESMCKVKTSVTSLSYTPCKFYMSQSYLLVPHDKPGWGIPVPSICLDTESRSLIHTRQLFGCKKSSNVRDSFMKKINSLTHFNTLSKEDKLRKISNSSCENHVINDIMKYIKKKQFVSFIA